MKKLIAIAAFAVFTVALTSVNTNVNDDQIAGDETSTQTQEPGQKNLKLEDL